MSFLSEMLIKTFEAELAAYGPEVEKFALEALGKCGAELVAYVTQKVVAANPPAAPVVTPQSVE